MAREIIARNFSEGFSCFTGGYHALILTPNEAYPVLPDGSLPEPRMLSRGERARVELTLAQREAEDEYRAEQIAYTGAEERAEAIEHQQADTVRYHSQSQD